MLDRSQKFITGYKLGCGHWRGRGKSHYKFVLGAGAKVKSVTMPINYTVRVSVSDFIFLSWLIVLLIC